MTKFQQLLSEGVESKYKLSSEKLSTKKEEFLAKLIVHAMKGGEFYWSITVDHGNGEAQAGRDTLEGAFFNGISALEKWFASPDRDPSDYLYIAPVYREYGAGTGIAVNYNSKTIVLGKRH